MYKMKFVYVTIMLLFSVLNPVIAQDSQVQLNNQSSKSANPQAQTVIKAVVVKSSGSPGDTQSIWERLNANWSDYGATQVNINHTSLLSAKSFTFKDLINSKADVVILSNSAGAGHKFSIKELIYLLNYVAAGHNIIGTHTLFQNPGFPDIDNRNLAIIFGLKETLQYAVSSVDPVYYYQDPSSHLFNNIPERYVSSGLRASQVPASGSWTIGDLNKAVIVGSTADNKAVITAFNGSSFNSIYISNMPEYNGSTIDERFLYNAITYQRPVVTGWLSNIVFTEGSNIIPLQFGVHPLATSRIDADLGESELPPYPIAGTFEVRFIGPDIGNGSFYDFRGQEEEKLEWIINIQRAAGGDVLLGWAISSGFEGSLRLQDMFGGRLGIDIDMTSTNGYTITDRAIDQVKILYAAEQYITPPVFVRQPVVVSDTSSAVILFTTDKPATTEIYYNTELLFNQKEYKVYSDPALVEKHKAHLTGLQPGTKYKFYAQAVDGNGMRAVSIISTFKTLEKPDLESPVILGIPTERNIDTTSVTIVWSTDEPSNSIVYIREAGSQSEPQDFPDEEYVTKHSVDISGLQPSTRYEYWVSSEDEAGNSPVFSRVQVFKTLASADVTPPQVTFGPVVLEITHISAVIKLKTNELSYASVNYGTDLTLADTVSDGIGHTEHSIKLTGLADSTVYYFQVEGSDTRGNSFIFPPEAKERPTFKTKVIPVIQDTTPPKIIEGPIEINVDSDRMTIFWKTNVLSNSTLEYGTSTDLRQLRTNTDLVLNHRVALTNLTADTKYYYRVRSRRENNREIVSKIFTVSTLAEPDSFPPIITSGPIASFIESNKATIWWKTDKNSSSRIDYGLNSLNLNGFEKSDEIAGVRLHQVQLTGLEADTTYYYRVSSVAENDSVVVSRLSRFATLAAPDTIPPRIIAGPDPTSIEDRTVTIEWTTDELSTSKVEYGLWALGVRKYTEFIWVDADAAGVINHKAVLTGLTPGTLYNYRVISRDLSAQLNEVESRNKRFATAAAQDTTPPVITSGPIVDWTEKSATFEWETDELSDSFVLIRKANTTDNFRKIGDEHKVTTHIVTATNLEPAQEYEYEIASRDLTGNLVTWPTSNGGGTLMKFLELRKVAQPPGGGGTFETDQEPDTQQPIIIEGPAVVAKTAKTITVQWKTDERSDSFVDYGFTPAYGSVKGDAADVTEHSITLTNLMASTVYNFKVNSTDIDNNGPAFSGNAAVTTDAEADQTPPKITAGPIVESITDDQATIIWETDELSDTYIEFGTTTDYGLVRISTEDVIVHSITLTNLLSDTTYYFRVSSTDISDNGPTTSADTTFTTAATPDETPPVISNVGCGAVTDKTATITFTTDELGDTFVDYGIISTTEFKVGNAQDVFDHEITLTNLLPDTTYRFKVGSIDKSDNEDTLNVDFAFKTAAAPDTIPPAAPSGFAGVEGNTQVLLMWNPNMEDDLAGYNIYRKAGVDTTLIATLVADTFYQDDGLTNGEVYGYFISAADNRIPYNESSSTSIVNLTPDEAKSPSIPAQSLPEEGQRIRYNEINITVENSTPPEGRSLTYEFVIAEEPDFFNQVAFGENVAEGSTYTTWYSGLELTHDQTYHWKSRAFDGFFYSGWSGARSFIADTTGTTNVTLVDFWGEDNEGVVALGWETSRETNNAGFNIYRSLNENEGFEKINKNLISCKDNAYNYTDTDVETGRTYYYRLESVSSIGFAEKLGTVAVEVTTPRTFKLYQNYPNPFNPVTTIKFDLPRPERVRIKIYNILGQEVKELFDEPKKAGYHVEQWDGTDKLGRPVASGLYIYRIIAGEFVQAKKMVLIR